MTVVLVGVISSLIASIVYALLSFGIKPKIKISDKICVTASENGSFTFKIKVVNRSRFQLVNVSYHLDYGFPGRDDISYMTEILPNKSPMSTITKKNKKNTDFAIRVSYKVDGKEYEINDSSYFDFTIQATHPLSNSVICKKKRYYKNDLAHDCTFQTGESTDILDLRGAQGRRDNQKDRNKNKGAAVL